MKRRLIGAICLLASVFMVGCGASNEDVVYANGYTAAEFQKEITGMANDLESMPADQLAYACEAIASSEEKEAQIYGEMFNDWLENREVAGSFVGFGEFTIDKTGKTLTVTQVIDYTDRDLKMIMVMKSRNCEITALNVEQVYSTSEKMGKAALNTVMGILTVFVMLIIISLIISCFKFIPAIVDFFTNRKEKKAKVNEPVVDTTVTAVEETVEDDLELIAVITAAIAASTGASTDSFVVRSIKRR